MFLTLIYFIYLFIFYAAPMDESSLFFNASHLFYLIDDNDTLIKLTIGWWRHLVHLQYVFAYINSKIEPLYYMIMGAQFA